MKLLTNRRVVIAFILGALLTLATAAIPRTNLASLWSSLATTEVLVAFVSGAFAVSATLAPFLYKSISDYLKRPPLLPARQRAVSGIWEGRVQQKKGPGGQSIEYDISLDVTATARDIVGTATNAYREEGGIALIRNLNITGGYYYERFLFLQYSSDKDAVIQFGSIVLELSRDGRTLKGRFLGQGVHTKGLVYGTLSLKKMPDGVF